jgi:steroid delta-isomerase-like uncharacterized protein
MRRVIVLVAVLGAALSSGLLSVGVTAGADASAAPDPDAATRQLLQRYIDSKHTDMSVMADDVEYTIFATGQQFKGVEEVRGMLDFFYRGAFDADATVLNLVIDGDRAIVEGEFEGVHAGEFAGIPATGNEVRVPMAVAFDLEDGLIKRGRVYFELPVLMAQIAPE